MIVNPRGEVITEAADGERVISAEVNLGEVNSYRTELPFLRDMRADYGKLAS